MAGGWCGASRSVFACRCRRGMAGRDHSPDGCAGQASRTHRPGRGDDYPLCLAAAMGTADVAPGEPLRGDRRAASTDWTIFPFNFARLTLLSQSSQPAPSETTSHMAPGLPGEPVPGVEVTLSLVSGGHNREGSIERPAEAGFPKWRQAEAAGGAVKQTIHSGAKRLPEVGRRIGGRRGRLLHRNRDGCHGLISFICALACKPDSLSVRKFPAGMWIQVNNRSVQ